MCQAHNQMSIRCFPSATDPAHTQPWVPGSLPILVSWAKLLLGQQPVMVAGTKKDSLIHLTHFSNA